MGTPTSSGDTFAAVRRVEVLSHAVLAWVQLNGEAIDRGDAMHLARMLVDAADEAAAAASADLGIEARRDYLGGA